MLTEYAREELQRAGLFDTDADYDGAAAAAVMELVTVFARQGHSGGSAGLVLSAFDKVARFEPLTPLTTDPAEWMDVSGASGGEPMWQSRRKPSVFSTDGGRTAYDLDTGRQPVELVAR